MKRTLRKLQIGDLVFSRPEQNAEAPLRPSRIERTFAQMGNVLELHLNGQVISTTTEHPFYIREKGWVAARDLQVGDALLGHDGRSTRIDLVYKSDRVEMVYNLRIEQDHTYFVGAEEWGFSVWVHNTYLKRQAADGTWEVYNDATGNVVGKGFANGPSADQWIKGLPGSAESLRGLSSKAKDILNGKDVHVSSIEEADALLEEALPNAVKVKGTGPGQSGPPNYNDFKGKDSRGMYHKDYHFNPTTGRIYGHNVGNPHGNSKHINLKLPDGRKVAIIIDNN